MLRGSNRGSNAGDRRRTNEGVDLGAIIARPRGYVASLGGSPCSRPCRWASPAGLGSLGVMGRIPNGRASWSVRLLVLTARVTAIHATIEPKNCALSQRTRDARSKGLLRIPFARRPPPQLQRPVGNPQEPQPDHACWTRHLRRRCRHWEPTQEATDFQSAVLGQRAKGHLVSFEFLTWEVELGRGPEPSLGRLGRHRRATSLQGEMTEVAAGRVQTAAMDLCRVNHPWRR